MLQNQVFSLEAHFHFNDCDPAGIFYFGNVPNLCHRTYENWLTSLKKDWGFWFNNSEWIIPIKNCQVDYQNPMKAGEPYLIQMVVGQMSQSSFTTQYRAVYPKTQTPYFKAEIVHVFVDKKSFQKTTIPMSIRSLFEPYLKAGTHENR
ncbi:MAG: thioesterase family protein [Bdellovibrionaceae bacterium]|nr:thioesterase family protein [Pseudobdellovibrionaceae bacterium]